jgi:hypothetical protein
MGIETQLLEQIGRRRHGFMIADMVLGDTLHDYAAGTIQADELQLALSQHRLAFEGYVRDVRSWLGADRHRRRRLKMGSGMTRMMLMMMRQNQGR